MEDALVNDDKRFDAIVIGSGIGGMAAAGLLSRLLGRRVLVLERHFELGGFTHVFRRGAWEWDVGLHYVGEMGKGGMGLALMDYLTNGRLEWVRMPGCSSALSIRGSLSRSRVTPRRTPGISCPVPGGSRGHPEVLP